MGDKAQQAFALWVTGLPASGKSTLVRALKDELAGRGIDVAVLESDELRRTLTPQAHYDDAERDAFYRTMAYIGTLLTRHGVPVIFDATANRRAYREQARREIPRFLEIYAECPLATCVARDPKGIYRLGRQGASSAVPGLQAAYEPPETPDLVVRTDREEPEPGARKIVALLTERGFIPRE